ncbi:hypothetical protein AYI68_g6601 [Smittium mucronatum]|uniref:Uncharacterized protein n=1 Tax=Smittium mucronatum TaxID=133383 RepID=A0A1R0GR09_9FUNG|nr:hypothetical protein AYI68_g6601 [Smittium mucronatum]
MVQSLKYRFGSDTKVEFDPEISYDQEDYSQSNLKSADEEIDSEIPIKIDDPISAPLPTQASLDSPIPKMSSEQVQPAQVTSPISIDHAHEPISTPSFPISPTPISQSNSTSPSKEKDQNDLPTLNSNQNSNTQSVSGHEDLSQNITFSNSSPISIQNPTSSTIISSLPDKNLDSTQTSSIDLSSDQVNTTPILKETTPETQLTSISPTLILADPSPETSKSPSAVPSLSSVNPISDHLQTHSSTMDSIKSPIDSSLIDDPKSVQKISIIAQNDNTQVKSVSQQDQIEPISVEKNCIQAQSDPTPAQSIAKQIINDSDIAPSDSNQIQNNSDQLQVDPLQVQNDSQKTQSNSNQIKIDPIQVQSDLNQIQSDSKLNSSDSKLVSNESNEVQSDSIQVQNFSDITQSDSKQSINDTDIIQIDSNQIQSDYIQDQKDSIKIQSDSILVDSESVPINNDSAPVQVQDHSISIQNNSSPTQSVSIEAQSDFIQIQDSPFPLKKNGTQAQSDPNPTQSDPNQIINDSDIILSDSNQIQSSTKQISNDCIQAQSDPTPTQSDPNQIISDSDIIPSDSNQIQSSTKQISNDCIQAQSDSIQVDDEMAQTHSDSTPIQNDPIQVQHHSNSNQNISSLIQNDPNQIQNDSVQIQSVSAEIQDHTISAQSDSNQAQNDSILTEGNFSQVQKDSTSVQDNSIQAQDDCISIQNDHTPNINEVSQIQDDPLSSLDRPLTSLTGITTVQSDIILVKSDSINSSEIHNTFAVNIDENSKNSDISPKTPNNTTEDSSSEFILHQNFQGKIPQFDSVKDTHPIPQKHNILSSESPTSILNHKENSLADIHGLSALPLGNILLPQNPTNVIEDNHPILSGDTITNVDKLESSNISNLDSSKENNVVMDLDSTESFTNSAPESVSTNDLFSDTVSSIDISIDQKELKLNEIDSGVSNIEPKITKVSGAIEVVKDSADKNPVDESVFDTSAASTDIILENNVNIPVQNSSISLEPLNEMVKVPEVSNHHSQNDLIAINKSNIVHTLISQIDIQGSELVDSTHSISSNKSQINDFDDVTVSSLEKMDENSPEKITSLNLELGSIETSNLEPKELKTDLPSNPGVSQVQPVNSSIERDIKINAENPSNVSNHPIISKDSESQNNEESHTGAVISSNNPGTLIDDTDSQITTEKGPKRCISDDQDEPRKNPKTN